MIAQRIGSTYLSSLFGYVDAVGAYQQVFFDDGEIGVVLHQSKVEAFKIVVGNVGQILRVDGAAKVSPEVVPG